jgi:structural maintenance of chromosome 4
VRVLEVDLSTQIEDYRRSIKEHTQKAQQWQKKLATLREAAAQSALLLPPSEDPDVLVSAPPLPALSEEELEALDAGTVQAEIDELDKELQGLSPNLSVLSEYRTRESEWRGRLAEFDAVTEERDATRRTYEELRKRRLSDFMAGFKVIGLRLKEMYQMITLGGDAELELVDSLDPFSEGIVFSVRPPKKSWKNIANLSGGEKTLSSLALVFALHHYKPTPLYVMDEIDAALDFRNVSIVGNYIKERTRNAQFIIISLRNNMFELADRLVGIYKTNDCTKSVTINPTAFTIAGRA